MSTNKGYINNNIGFYNSKYNLDIPYYVNNKGLSIGAMSSQFLAIFYLNDLDHYIKEKLRCKYYIRYMDDILILSYDKEYLKYCYGVIKEELSKLKLSVNKKSNIYKLSNGFNFLGYRYRVINNKLDISFSNDNYYKIVNNLFNLLYKRPIKYYKSHASYYGVFKVVYSLEDISFDMKVMDIYNLYKEKYKSSVILIKEGIFYRTYNDDSVIMNYIFGYKLVDNYVGFSNNSYNKVLDKLREIGIGFVVIDKDSVLLVNDGDIEVYDMYLKLGNKVLDRKNKEDELVNKIRSINYSKYDLISEYLDKLI